ncbi:MAG TPA: bifunctional riboflavin kinase/FAD synthetase [Clostridia bacterium]|nr:bifunctional riboflavin kinase/FAD synthetase [Clostridia bacterium]
MQVFRKLDEVPADFGPSVLTVGNFDGVHKAHQYVLHRIVERAREIGAKAVVLTFDPHPVRILRPREAPPLITPMPHKLRLLEEIGIDAIVVLPFSRDLSMMPPFEFAEEILATALHAIEVHEGFNFRFGHKAEGDANRLLEFGHKLGFEVHIYNAMKVRGHVVSSSEVRKLVQAGDMDRTRRLLGRPFTVFSTPGRGRGYGHRYTVPTINLSRYDELVPKDGVYISRIGVADEVFDSVTNVGMRPTFGDDGFAIETHILNFHPIELTAQTEVELLFLKRLRDEVKFPSTDALKEQIGRDVAKAQRFFHLLERFAHQ